GGDGWRVSAPVMQLSTQLSTRTLKVERPTRSDQYRVHNESCRESRTATHSATNFGTGAMRARPSSRATRQRRINSGASFGWDTLKEAEKNPAKFDKPCLTMHLLHAPQENSSLS